jgi:NADH:ubiquinone oxidoreductase subunit C
VRYGSDFRLRSLSGRHGRRLAQRQPRFDVVHHFYSTRDHVRVRIKTRVEESDPTVDSLVAFYGSARYMERECHEMYGIVFRGNETCVRCCSMKASSATRCARTTRSSGSSR